MPVYGLPGNAFPNSEFMCAFRAYDRLAGVQDALTETAMLDNIARHLVTPERIKNGDVAKYKHAWVLRDAKRLVSPISYYHPSGAVIWVNLQPAVVARLAE
ncbi:MAG: hypothetical protein LH632_14045 [Rhodoferax sp.]|nr:hypothetical protein [Rhodoferax sp.]